MIRCVHCGEESYYGCRCKRTNQAEGELVPLLEEVAQELATEGYEDGGPTYLLTRLKAAIAKLKGGT